MANNNKGLVDNSQVLKKAFDANIEALRFIPAEATEFAVELNAADGDSVIVPNSNSFASASATLENGSSGDAIASLNSLGSKSFQLYAEVLATAGASTAGDLIVKIEISPSDSGAFYSLPSLTVPTASVVGAMVQGSLTAALSKRIKVTIVSNALAAGDQVKVYLLGGSN